MSAVLSARGLRKTYLGGDGRPLEILSGVDLDVGRGEFVAVVGESGAGKSTLLHLLGALDAPSDGTIVLDGLEYDEAGADDLDILRNRKIGFVFQFHHLLRDFTALENVMMPLRIAGTAPAEARERAEGLLRQVGLGERLTHRPPQLSGGEQQRVAVARALANDPRLVLADEPSGNLDLHQADRLHDLLATLARDFETALVVVTHNRQLAARADRILAVEGGRLVPVDKVEVGG
ncbi:MAG TPA: ABC transporter ATP-binding protein [Gemmatimonadales bacterium]|nr:ABC transporter ATP-binding protein [Gemmatimonadales bacterium]